MMNGNFIPGQMMQPNIPMQQMQPNMNFQNQLFNFAQSFQSNGTSPQAMVQQMLNSGQMSQQQYNQLREVANRLTGLNM